MPRRSVALTASLLVALVLPAAPGSSAAPAPGTTGSAAAQTAAAQTAAAQTAANEAGARVATLDADVRRATARVRALTAVAISAQSRVDVQLARQRSDSVQVRRARAAATTAAATYDRAHRAFVQVVVAQYEGTTGAVMSTAGQLLTSRDPGQFLVSAELTSMVAQYRAQVSATNEAAARASAAAAARLESATAARNATTLRVQRARDSAGRALSAATRSLRALRAGLARAQVDQARTDAVLSRFLGGWSLADPARADALDRHYLDLARSHSATPLAPAGKHWTAEQGWSVVWRSLMWIGTPYAWAGGDAGGPTTGRCVSGDASNDCHVTGFDCSGLSLYGWAPYLSMPHLASAQYGATGRLHPDIADLLPGDLLFWSSDGSVAGIHHVALYIGDGLVLQAPNSGDIIRVTPLGSVDSGYYGATRPRS